MKEFIKELKVKKVKAGELAEYLANNQDDLVEFYVKNGFKQKFADTINSLYEKMMNEKFVKALKKILKSEDVELNIGWAVIINGFLEKKGGKDTDIGELAEQYGAVLDKLLKKRTKEVRKLVKLLDDETIKELLILVPNPDIITNDKATGFYTQKILRKLYYMAKDNDLGLTTVKDVKKMFRGLFGKETLDVISVYILLEKKDYMKGFNEQQTALWNLITDFALETIESQEKDHILELIDYYCDRRKFDDGNNRDSARRINMSNVDSEQYPKLAKGISKYQKKGKESLSKYL